MFFLPKYRARFHEHLRNKIVLEFKKGGDVTLQLLSRRSCLILFKYCGLLICVDFNTAQLESNLYNISFVHKMAR